MNRRSVLSRGQRLVIVQGMVRRERFGTAERVSVGASVGLVGPSRVLLGFYSEFRSLFGFYEDFTWISLGAY